MQACVRTFVPTAPIDYELARAQHDAYCAALRACGADVVTLDVNSDLPDCAFIEDTAVILDEVAILCSLGTPSRRAEPAGIEPALARYRQVIRLAPPATLEGGDVLRLGRTLLVGHSCRTNAAGIAALTAIASRHGYRVRSIPITGCLHLKTACTTLPDGQLLLNPAWLHLADLADFNLLPIPLEEPWAANIALAGATVLLSAQYPRTAAMIQAKGFDICPLDLSEFAKAEGGPTCLSLLLD
jgi:dimethylargininase